LAWLQDVLGESSNTIHNAFEYLRTVDNMNLDSAFIYGVLLYPMGDLSVAQTTSFVDRLATLMTAGSETAFHRGAFEGRGGF